MTQPQNTQQRDRQPGQGGGEDAPPQPDKSPEAQRRNRLGSIFVGLIVVSFIVTMYPLPYKMFAGVLAVVALVYGFRFISAAAKAKQQGSWVITGVLGILLCLYTLGSTASTALIYPVQAAYEECTVSALTQQASAACISDFQKGLQETLNRLSGQG